MAKSGELDFIKLANDIGKFVDKIIKYIQKLQKWVQEKLDNKNSNTDSGWA